MIVFILLQLLLASSSYGLFGDKFSDHVVNYLHVNRTHVQEALTLLQSIYIRNCVHIYCRNDQSLQLNNIFQSNRLRLITMEPHVKYVQYKAMTASGIYQAYLLDNQCEEGKLMTGGSKQLHYITLPSHSQFCYGIYTDQAYNLTLLQKAWDVARATRFASGILLWLMAAKVGESLILGYSVAIVLGLHLASFGVVCAALFIAGDYRLKSVQPLGENFKLLLERHPTIVALSLVSGAWLMVKFHKRYRTLRHYQFVSSLHYRLLRGFSYYLILNASDHVYFGWFCVCLLWPWPELYHLIQWLRTSCVKMKRCCFPPELRRLISEEEFQARSGFETQQALTNLSERLRNVRQPMWEHVAQLREPQEFARFVCSGTLVPPDRIPRAQSTFTTASASASENVAGSLLEQLTAVINNHSSGTNESAESLYRNINYTGSTRSLRSHPAQN